MTNERRRLTLDFAGADPEEGNARFYTTEQLGPKQSLTPEGFLLCEDVPLARPGEMIYGPDETPIDAGPDGITRITRTLEELFRPETLASFNGKPVTNEHPDEDVTPDNWKRYTVGVLLNVRPGIGDNEGLMVGDLLITDPQTIQDIRSDKREVSLGYDADYKKTADGEGTQANIIGNHVALVERGRCGPRCAIHDHETHQHRKEPDMGNATSGAQRRRLSESTVRRVLDKAVNDALLEMERMEGGEQTSLSKDEDGMGKPLTGEGLQHIHIHLNESSAPAGQTGALNVEKAQDNYPSGPEFPENPNAGNSPSRIPTQDDPYEARFQALEGAVAAILQKLDGGAAAEPPGAGGPAMGHGEPDGDEPGSAAQAPGASPMAPERIQDAEVEELAEEMSESTGNEVTKDAARKVRDSAPLANSYQALISDCEILVPGFRAPVFDAAVHPVDTIYRMCGTRKKALDLAYMTNEGKHAIDTAMRGRAFDSSVMDCKCIRKTFDAAVAVRAVLNNGNQHSNVVPFNHTLAATPAPKLVSGEDLNAFYKSHYGR